MAKQDNNNNNEAVQLHSNNRDKQPQSSTDTHVLRPKKDSMAKSNEGSSSTNSNSTNINNLNISSTNKKTTQDKQAVRGTKNIKKTRKAGVRTSIKTDGQRKHRTSKRLNNEKDEQKRNIQFKRKEQHKKNYKKHNTDYLLEEPWTSVLNTVHPKCGQEDQQRKPAKKQSEHEFKQNATHIKTREETTGEESKMLKQRTTDKCKENSSKCNDNRAHANTQDNNNTHFAIDSLKVAACKLTANRSNSNTSTPRSNHHQKLQHQQTTVESPRSNHHDRITTTVENSSNKCTNLKK